MINRETLNKFRKARAELQKIYERERDLGRTVFTDSCWISGAPTRIVVEDKATLAHTVYRARADGTVTRQGG